MDIKTVLDEHHTGPDKKNSASNKAEGYKTPSLSEIPDIFFDDILLTHKLNRVEILVFMHFYRLIWCRPNLHKKYGISPLMSHSELTLQLRITPDQFFHALRNLESYGLVETIRAGQYFVRRFFTEEFDARFGQYYDDFM